MKKTKKTGEKPALPDAAGKSFVIIVADFYADLAAQLEDGARRGLRACVELPIAARRLIAGSKIDGVVALGVVIRGDTPHFDYVAGECARGIMDVQLGSGVPIGFGVLTTENRAQAEERADPARGDKGYEAAVAAATVAVIEPKRNGARVGFR
jgi:6,7-dimethyl-8-ribityllumazine synthase